MTGESVYHITRLTPTPSAFPVTPRVAVADH